MALLPDAIRASETDAAMYRFPDGSNIVVQRVTGKEEPDSKESWVVRLYGPAGESRDRYDADDLVEAVARLRGLGIPDFDPDTPNWEPTVGPREIDHQPVVHAP